MKQPHEAQAAAMARSGELPDGEQLRECIASGQVSAAQVVAHAGARELPDPPKAEWLWNVGPTHTSDQMRAYAAAAATALAAQQEEVARLREVIFQGARIAEQLKRECGMDPESLIAIQNSRYMGLSYFLRAALNPNQGAKT